MRLLVCNCFDVPISLLQTENSNRAVAQESTYQHQYYAIEPRCILIAAALTAQLAKPVDDRLFFAFDDSVMRDTRSEAQVFDLEVKNGIRTINEARALNGDPPVPWGDEPWLANTLQQPSQAEAQVQLQQAQADAQGKQAEAQLAALNSGTGTGAETDAGDTGDPGDAGIPTPDDAPAGAGRAGIEATLTRVLAKIEADLDARRRAADPDDGDAGGVPPGVARGGDAPRPGPARDEPLRPAGWDADRDDAPEVLPEAAGGDPDGPPGWPDSDTPFADDPA